MPHLCLCSLTSDPGSRRAMTSKEKRLRKEAKRKAREARDLALGGGAATAWAVQRSDAARVMARLEAEGRRDSTASIVSSQLGESDHCVYPSPGAIRKPLRCPARWHAQLAVHGVGGVFSLRSW